MRDVCRENGGYGWKTRGTNQYVRQERKRMVEESWRIFRPWVGPGQCLPRELAFNLSLLLCQRSAVRIPHPPPFSAASKAYPKRASSSPNGRAKPPRSASCMGSRGTKCMPAQSDLSNTVGLKLSPYGSCAARYLQIDIATPTVSMLTPWKATSVLQISTSTTGESSGTVDSD